MKSAERSRLYREALWIFGVAALVLVAASVAFQLWIASATGAGVAPLPATFFALLTGAVVLIAGGAYVRRISRRVQQLQRGLEAVRGGQYPLLVVKGDDELSELTVGFNQLVEALRARDERLSDWVENRETEMVDFSRAAEPGTARLGTRLEAAGEGLVVLDREGRVILATEPASELLGVPAEALTGVTLRSLVDQLRHRLADAVEAERQLRALTSEGGPREMDLALDGGGGAVRVYATPVSGADGAVLRRIAGLMDSDKGREVERLKSEFLSTISHELRTPLTSVKGALGLIRGGAAGQINADMRELLEIASTNIDRLITVINNILDVLTLERGQAGFRFSPQALGDCVARAAQLVAGSGEREGVVVETRVPLDLPPVRADATRLEQVMVNLLSNAIKFSRSGQTVLVSAAAANGTVQVSVQDFGRGIGREAMGRLFQKFEHSEEALTRATQGAGLGLAICRHIVEAHGGRIWVESVEGKGSTFFFTVPTAAPAEGGAALRRSVPAGEAS